MNHSLAWNIPPFVRDVPPEKLFESNAFRETLGRLAYVADRQMFAVVTADSGCGKRIPGAESQRSSAGFIRNFRRRIISSFICQTPN